MSPSGGCNITDPSVASVSKGNIKNAVTRAQRPNNEWSGINVIVCGVPFVDQLP